MKRLLSVLLLCGLAVLWLSPAWAGKFLDPAVAFQTRMRPLDGQTVELQFTLAKGYYLYRDKVKIRLEDPPAGVTVGEILLPQGHTKNDENFGEVMVYYDELTVRIPVQGLASHTPGVAELRWNIRFQGCADAGLCYPPQTRLLTASDPQPEAPVVQPAPAKTPPRAQPLSESDRIAGLFAGGNFGWVILSFFGFGLLLSLTPCIFPMIPILSGIIVGQKSALSKMRGFLLSLAYVLGMAVTYAAVGVAAGLSGTLISNAMQTPLVLGVGALLLVVLALSMFGFYELQLPSALQSRVAESSNRLQGGQFTGVFAMGALSALIVGPCVAAPLAGALIYIGQSGDVVLGGVALFAMGMGMGMPLLVVGLSAGALLPRAGGWMDGVKHFFGVLLLLVAVWMIQPVVPVWVAMALWAVLLVGWGVHLGVLESAPAGWPRLGKTLAVLLLTLGLALILGLLGGSRDPLQPLEVFATRSGSGQPQAASAHLAFQRIRELAELEKILATAHQPVMLDFYADWCVSCKEMEKFTFADPRVQAQLQSVVLLQADVTHQTAADQALLKHFGLFGPPAILFFDAKGQEQSHLRVIGYQDAPAFLAQLGQWLR
ncbi:MAG: protein-disulfide reductase DsbD [Magnetococcales bacterium]|nr:protein-disulfide reductase DsbD [Magnetococcales bacterium]